MLFRKSEQVFVGGGLDLKFERFVEVYSNLFSQSQSGN